MQQQPTSIQPLTESVRYCLSPEQFLDDRPTTARGRQRHITPFRFRPNRKTCLLPRQVWRKSTLRAAFGLIYLFPPVL